MAGWRIEASQLPTERDRLTALQEMLLYYLLWCQWHGKEVAPIAEVARGLRCNRETVCVGLRRLRGLGLARVQTKRRVVLVRRAHCEALRLR